jgi:hypothetical protein
LKSDSWLGARLLRVLEFGNMEKPEKKKKNNNKKIKLSEPWEIAAT